jgi:tetratricopeptide (TPR) repeat protein
MHALPIAALVLAVMGWAPVSGQSAAGAQLLPGMGTYSHPIQTTSPEAQAFFDQGLALLYNFNHAEAERSFLKAAELDPKAPMPWWGVGIALGLNYNRDVTKLEGERLTRAYDAAQKAVSLSRAGSPVEAALADALATRYSRDANADPNVLNALYRDAMRQAYVRYPDDPEVGTMYADATMNLRPWQLWKRDGTPEADTLELVKVLEAVLRRHPNHPGANHYYVHAVEASPTPERALASATRLETLVPGAGHLVHMPTHIYIHTGHIGRVAELNAKAAAADERYIEVAKPEGLYPFMYYGHNVHFVVVGNLLTGRYEDALKAGRQMACMVAPHMAQMGPMVEWALALPTLAHVRFHKWDVILAAPRPPDSQPLAQSFDRYARALALQMTMKSAEARAEAAAFETARGKVPAETLVVSFNNGPTVLAMVSHLLQGQLAGSVDEAVTHLEMAAAAQDALNYDEPEPWPWSVRETLGAVLLKAGRAVEAEKVFRADLEKNPASGRTLFGLTKSLEAQGRTAEAAIVQREFDEAWKQATSPLSVDALF